MKPTRVFLCILLVVSLLTLFSCKDKDSGKDEIPPREYDESEVIENATHLIHLSEKVNTIVWGVGILPVDDEVDAGVYRPCSEEEMDRYNIRSVEDIRRRCRSVYSSGVCQTIENTILQNVRDENESIVSFVRYYDEVDSETKQTTLMVNTGANVYFDKAVEYYSETIQIKEVKGEVIYLTIDVTVYDDENNAHEMKMTFSLIEEEDGWKLHSPTYMKYNPYADIYDDLTKQ